MSGSNPLPATLCAIQNDVQTVANTIASVVGGDGFRPDDCGNTLGTAFVLPAGSQQLDGFIERYSDADIFCITVAADGNWNFTNWNFTATPVYDSTAQPKLELIDAAGTVIAARDDAALRNGLDERTVFQRESGDGHVLRSRHQQPRLCRAWLLQVRSDGAPVQPVKQRCRRARGRRQRDLRPRNRRLHPVRRRGGYLERQRPVPGISGTPTVATPTAAIPNPTTATSVDVSVLGADEDGEEALTYSWSATGPGAVTFTVGGTNAAKNSTATFNAAGTYQITATITDPGGLSTTSNITVTVNPVLGAIAGTSPTMATGTSQQITLRDQFGAALASGPPIVWSASAGAITPAGVYTAPATPVAAMTITAQAGSETYRWHKANETSGTTLADATSGARHGTLPGDLYDVFTALGEEERGASAANIELELTSTDWRDVSPFS